MASVLLVDADGQLRRTYAKSLEQAGHVVAAAASAQTAIAECEKTKPDIVVLELQLQGHSGLEFLQEFRSYTEWAYIPVILHTMVPRQSLSGFDEALKTYGIIKYLYKPQTSLKQLAVAVQESLGVE